MVERIFRCGGARPPIPQMIAFIDDHRCVHGVGPICRVLGIAPSIGRQANAGIRREATYYAFKAVERDPGRASDRARQDRLDKAAIKQVFDGSRGRYGARKVWHQLRREGHDIARCTVVRLMQILGLQGPSRQNCCAIRLPGNGCARQEGHHDQPRYGTTLPGR